MEPISKLLGIDIMRDSFDSMYDNIMPWVCLFLFLLLVGIIFNLIKAFAKRIFALIKGGFHYVDIFLDDLTKKIYNH